jgi:uncharacterized membrane protein
MVSTMDWGRFFRHLFSTKRSHLRAFPLSTLDAIEAAITASEKLHSAEIRFAIEGSLEPHEIRHGKTPRARALEVFAALGVWDTHANNGVLIYVLLADQDVEIVADRGFNLRVTSNEWSDICHAMERLFKAGDYEAGAIEGVRRAGDILATHFPPLPGGRDEDELPNRPAVL